MSAEQSQSFSTIPRNRRVNAGRYRTPPHKQKRSATDWIASVIRLPQPTRPTDDVSASPIVTYVACMSTGKAAVRRPRMTRKWRAKVLASGLSDVLPVECGEMHARLHLFKIGSGTRGTSIEWEGNWLTPVQFEQISGMERAHNWKQSIRYENRSLNCYIKLGLIKLHHRYCDCDRCITPLLELDKSRTSKVLLSLCVVTPGYWEACKGHF